MRKYLLSGFLGVIILILAACGGDDPTAVPVASATAVPAQPQATTASATTAPAVQAPASDSLASIAAKLAGGPGAIYVGDLKQLVGPVLEEDWGDADGNVPLGSLQDDEWIFTADYYKGLIKKAGFENPTELTTQGEEIKIQFACINRALTHCRLAEIFFQKNVLERTNGQLDIQMLGYPELGIAGPDVADLLDNGTLSIAEIAAAYVAGDMPALEVKYLWGLFQDHESFYQATANAIPAMDQLVADRTRGGVTILQLWRVGENDIFFFTKDKMETLEDFKGVKVRSFGGALSDWIDGMGAKAQFVAFAEVYTALERGILGGAVTGANAAFGQRWYEVTDHMSGPLPLFTVENMTVNKEVWDGLPADFQQILLEEGAKYELEFLRMAPILGDIGVPNIVAKGLTMTEFSPEIKAFSYNEVFLKKVLPSWINRAGGPTGDAVQLFNDAIGPVVGIRIESDGSVTKTGATAAMSGSSPTASALADIAAKLAGGPGAIYVGDLSQLVGPATRAELGELEGEAIGGVSLDVLKLYPWIYESDYYKSVLEKAKLDDPTPLVTRGQKFEIQWVPITRAIQRTKLAEDTFIPNVLERTEGQVEITIASFPELGVTGTDSISLVADGTVEFMEMYGGYIAGEFPFFDMMFLWGLYIEDKDQFLAVAATQGDVDRIISEQTNGGKVIFHGWAGEGPLSYFTKKPIRTLEDLKGQRLRTHSTGLSDWVIGMGAEAQFLAFAEVYTAMERGILDGGSTSPWGAHGQRWYEVVDYIIAPIASTMISFPEIMNAKSWNDLPPDIQQILLEEGAKYELETFRVLPTWNESGIPALLAQGMELIPMSPELKAKSFDVAVERVLPNWLKRLGGADTEGARIFNEKVTPILGVKINPDGSVVKVPITK